MKNFLNDYNDRGHEKVYDFLSKLPERGLKGYSLDEYSFSVREKLKKEIGRDDIDVEFVAGGTVANIVCATHTLRNYEAIVSAKTGHIAIHESGALEATGHKIITLESEDGKLNPELLLDRLSLFGAENDVIPKMLYISETAETGAVYTKDELKDLYEVCLQYGLYMFIDGARLSVALAATGMTLKDISEVCDIFTIGGTKNGALFGEALVIVDEDLKERFRNHMKQKGAIMAKGFILAAQFDGLFDQGLYYEIGEIAYEKAMTLKKKLDSLNISYAFKPESNQIFVKLSKDQIEELKNREVLFDVENLGTDKFNVRFCTCYRTSDEEIDGLIEDLKEIL